MTHNLRTPLATIGTALSTLRGATVATLAEGDVRELLTVAAGETDRLDRLVTKVLALSRIHGDAIDVAPEPVELADLARTAVRRLRVLAASRDIWLEVPPELPLVAADPALLEVVLVNLLENALRYAPMGPIEVRAHTERDGVALEVVDHGPGIAPAQREQAFGEFVRLEGGAESSGTGIGLTIARAFVQAQRGSISIDETPKGGTTVVVRLPRFEEEAA
jgi:two-component system sensor histidine kinase KdpD